MDKSTSNRKPLLENRTPAFGSTFIVNHCSEACGDSRIRSWHQHEQLELVFVKGGNGQRHIGNHVSCYHDGDLVLIGSMLPHTGFSDRLTGHESEVVVHFDKCLLGDYVMRSAEFKDICQLLERAQVGVAFHGKTKQEIGERLERLDDYEGFTKLIEFLRILQDLAISEEYTTLNAEGYLLETTPDDNDRINQVYGYVRKNFKRHIALEEMARVAMMTIPAFSRYFKRAAGKTFTRFVNEMRITHACKLISEQKMSITNICYESGFNNFSHFNRVFKDITGSSPSNYRKNLTKSLQYTEA